ncbi:hypothetical protein GH714_012475 [Hevea brasiliensis]|uniref:Signal peptidase complex subunit 2 n=1 Tax=Hevea brasiliensis TaxID=3981 RepID=A0A6A6N0T2_HEVBR|nr:hypothetical protein GH714_012475 [Hevea brasiliensis]
MQEKKPEMANKNPKKANLLDHHSIKHILDESVSEKLTSYEPMSTLKSSSKGPVPNHSWCIYIFTASAQNLLKFTKDGVLVEGLFWKDVEALINDYAGEPKKSK